MSKKIYTSPPEDRQTTQSEHLEEYIRQVGDVVIYDPIYEDLFLFGLYEDNVTHEFHEAQVVLYGKQGQENCVNILNAIIENKLIMLGTL